MPVSFNTDKALSLFKQKGGNTDFISDLKIILENSKNDKNINDVRDLAYLLATAKQESDYSLQRWEADYVCGLYGKRYDSQPCQGAVNYYCSTSGGKKNYCSDPKELDSRGLPYFGRGLINLTWKYNYDKYGRKLGIGDSLVKNPDLALNPEISYRIASTSMNEKKGSNKKSVFDYVKQGDFTTARRLVNGGIKGLEVVNREYNKWIDILLNSDFNKNKNKFSSTSIVIFSSVLIIFVIGFVAFKKIRQNNTG